MNRWDFLWFHLSMFIPALIIAMIADGENNLLAAVPLAYWLIVAFVFSVLNWMFPEHKIIDLQDSTKEVKK